MLIYYKLLGWKHIKFEDIKLTRERSPNRIFKAVLLHLSWNLNVLKQSNFVSELSSIPLLHNRYREDFVRDDSYNNEQKVMQYFF